MPQLLGTKQRCSRFELSQGFEIRSLRPIWLRSRTPMCRQAAKVLYCVVSSMAWDTSVWSLHPQLSGGVHRLTRLVCCDQAGSSVKGHNHPRGERHTSEGDLNQLCNWEQQCKSTMPKLDSVLPRDMKLSISYRSCRKRSISKKQVTFRRQHYEG
jgi:hypothetical protein